MEQTGKRAALRDELATAAAWLAEGRHVALATVVATWGSSPRPVGSHLVADGQGAFCGSVSGGCIESAVIAEARAVIADGRSRLLDFGVSSEQAWSAGLSCGGTLRVLVERLTDRPHLQRLVDCQAARQPVARIVDTQSGESGWVTEQERQIQNALSPEAADEIATLLAAGQCGFLTHAPDVFVRGYPPPLRLLLVGGTHISQALAPMAALTGCQVMLIDPRRGFANADRFPDVTIMTAWPDEALAELVPDESTALVTLTHDPKLDDPALIAALRSDAFYVGALGSRRTHAKRLARLGQDLPEHALKRIHAPVGLDLGGRSPAQIAVAILAEIIQVRHRQTQPAPVETP